MSVVRRYEIHCAEEDERPVLFISVTCNVKTKLKRDFIETDHALLSKTFHDILDLDLKKDMTRIKDPEGDDLIPDLTEVAQRKDIGKYKMLIVHISSFGDKGHIYTNDCEKIAINDIIDVFRGSKCMPMVGKPKWFIIQACTEGLYKPRSRSTECDASLTVEEKVTYVPSEADILTTISEVPGSVTWRKQGSNSPFIEHLCDNLRNNLRLDIAKIFNRTIQAVHEELQSKAAEEYKASGLLPYMTSTFTRALCFSTVYASISK